MKETVFLQGNLLQAEHPLTAQYIHYNMRSREERSETGASEAKHGGTRDEQQVDKCSTDHRRRAAFALVYE